MCIVEVALIIVGEDLVSLLDINELGFGCGALVFRDFVGMVGKSGLLRFAVSNQPKTMKATPDLPSGRPCESRLCSRLGGSLGPLYGK